MKYFKTDIDFYKIKFGERAQKIPIDAGFTCPNRDGRKSTKGCKYCNNSSFTPFYAKANISIAKQLNDGIEYFSKRYKTNIFLAYLQSYSGTYAPLEKLKMLYNQLLAHPQINGIIIGTRPDCLDEEKILFLKELSKKTFLKLEIGIESFSDTALDKVNRCHTVSDATRTLSLLKQAKILFGIHLIATLPEDSNANILANVDLINKSGISFVKLHHLQIIKNTDMAKSYLQNPSEFDLFTFDEYVEFTSEFIARLSTKIYIERFINRVPIRFLIAPKWHNVDENIFRTALIEKMKADNYTQGCLIK